MEEKREEQGSGTGTEGEGKDSQDKKWGNGWESDPTEHESGVNNTPGR